MNSVQRAIQVYNTTMNLNQNRQSYAKNFSSETNLSDKAEQQETKKKFELILKKVLQNSN